MTLSLNEYLINIRNGTNALHEYYQNDSLNPLTIEDIEFTEYTIRENENASRLLVPKFHVNRSRLYSFIVRIFRYLQSFFLNKEPALLQKTRNIERFSTEITDTLINNRAFHLQEAPISTRLATTYKVLKKIVDNYSDKINSRNPNTNLRQRAERILHNKQRFSDFAREKFDLCKEDGMAPIFDNLRNVFKNEDDKTLLAKFFSINIKVELPYTDDAQKLWCFDWNQREVDKFLEKYATNPKQHKKQLLLLHEFAKNLSEQAEGFFQTNIQSEVPVDLTYQETCKENAKKVLQQIFHSFASVTKDNYKRELEKTFSPLWNDYQSRGYEVNYNTILDCNIPAELKISIIRIKSCAEKMNHLIVELEKFRTDFETTLPSFARNRIFHFQKNFCRELQEFIASHTALKKIEDTIKNTEINISRTTLRNLLMFLCLELPYYPELLSEEKLERRLNREDISSHSFQEVKEKLLEIFASLKEKPKPLQKMYDTLVDWNLRAKYGKIQLGKKAYTVPTIPETLFVRSDSVKNYIRQLKNTESLKRLLSDSNGNTKIQNEIIEKFANFITKIKLDKNRPGTISDAYSKRFNKKNLQKLHNMLYGIFHILHKKQKENSRTSLEEHQAILKGIILQITEALEHCTNHMNVAVRNIFYNVFLGTNTGSLSHAIQQALQKERLKIFNQCVAEIDKEQFYCIDQASTLNFYQNQLGETLGLDLTKTVKGKNDELYNTAAYTYGKAKILSYFQKKYTALHIARFIQKKVIDPYDPEISSSLFTEWFRKTYSEEKQEAYMNEEYEYTISCLVRCLTDMEIFLPEQP